MQAHSTRRFLLVAAIAIVVLVAAISEVLPLRLDFTDGYMKQTRQAGSHDKPEEIPLRLYAEAIASIEREALFAEGVDDRTKIVTDSLKAYLANKDRYSDFLDSQEYAKFRAIGSHVYQGVGLELEKTRNGDIICYPFANSPAELAGIKPGERLAAIDGKSTHGKSLASLAILISGPIRTETALEIVSADGTHKSIKIVRSTINSKNISDYTWHSIRVIKILSFAPSTSQELKYLLSNWSATVPVIIDLRGCGGGDFHAAVDTAMLFLNKGDRIVSVQRRNGTRSYLNTTTGLPLRLQVILWQDGATASAAELFIAALIENSRAISIGSISAGKGTEQEIIELSGGSALILTTGNLLTPGGNRFDGKGLVPKYAVPRDATTDDYIRLMNDLFSFTPPSGLPRRAKKR
jgi:carboxyl-terminal processing protease